MLSSLSLNRCLFFFSLEQLDFPQELGLFGRRAQRTSSGVALTRGCSQYIAAVVADVALRFAWTLTISPSSLGIVSDAKRRIRRAIV